MGYWISQKLISKRSSIYAPRLAVVYRGLVSVRAVSSPGQSWIAKPQPNLEVVNESLSDYILTLTRPVLESVFRFVCVLNASVF